MNELSDDAKYIMSALAKTERGRLAMAELILGELQKISDRIDAAIARCEADANV